MMPNERVNEHLRVVMPNDPVPKSMKKFTHTCDKGSSQHFICYDTALKIIVKYCVRSLNLLEMIVNP
jgi:hypothetical protein